MFKYAAAVLPPLINLTVKVKKKNSGEYSDKKFTAFCAREGIRREWTTPYNLEQNGVVERKNWTIVGATKAILYDQDMPIFLWT